MKKIVSIGNQGFEDIRINDNFYVDKTAFIKEWWEARDIVTLITRPRRFGKTLNVDMLKCFFSNKYAGRQDLFEGLSIWEEEKYRKLQGEYPVISLSFADVKQTNYIDAVKMIKFIISDAFREYRDIMQSDRFTETDRQRFEMVNPTMDDVTAQRALKELGGYLETYYGRKVILFLDEYDTPMQEAYVGGYWDEFTAFIRSLFNSTFKTNPYLERAIMTGVTRVSKDMSYPCQGYDLRPHQRASFLESIFSDLNNLKVITTTSNCYEQCFGFTEPEVFEALDSFGLSSQKQAVKQWYDGFIFGNHKDIYNPWSITNFLGEQKLKAYWAATSSNHLVDRIIRTASSEVKEQMEDLLEGKEVVVTFDEQIVFNQLEQNESAIWSLLMASGYLKPEQVEYRGELMKPWYHLKITNLETRVMFFEMFAGWFQNKDASYSHFMQALVQDDLEAMNYFMNRMTNATFSYFDVGGDGYQQPEKFYHGFVLGLMAEQTENYVIKSNRESGFGRYDIMMLPKKEALPGIIMEFKVRSSRKEKSLEETVGAALQQIKERNYDAELLSLGIPEERIRHYGFAFDGKNVLIGSDGENIQY
ncbi:MAG: AAA family ATPase [Candidatus Gastranaerophilaceae bacterium]|mgnify:FL=1